MEGFVLVPLQPHTMNKFNGMWIDLHTQQVIAHSMGLLDERKKLVIFGTKRTGKCDCSNFNIILENSIFTVVYLWGPSLDHESQRKRAIAKCHNDLRLNTRAVFAKSRACFKSSVMVHLDKVCCFHSKPFPFALHFVLVTHWRRLCMIGILSAFLFSLFPLDTCLPSVKVLRLCSV
jgi:hypothetical protein